MLARNEKAFLCATEARKSGWASKACYLEARPPHDLVTAEKESGSPYEMSATHAVIPSALQNTGMAMGPRGSLFKYNTSPFPGRRWSFIRAK